MVVLTPSVRVYQNSNWVLEQTETGGPSDATVDNRELLFDSLLRVPTIRIDPHRRAPFAGHDSQELFFSQVLPCSSSSFVLVLESVPATKDRARGRGTRDEDELAWQVHGPDARPILEVEALHEPGP